MSTNRRQFLTSTGLAAAAAALPLPVFAKKTGILKIGMIAPMTGPFGSTGRMLLAGAQLFMAQQGDTVAGTKVSFSLRDDTAVPDVSRRVAQEMVANDGVGVLTGFGITPLALAAAPIATQAKVPQIVMMAASSIVTGKSPFIVRSCFTQPQTAIPMAVWAKPNGIGKVVTLVADYSPGVDTETAFVNRFKAEGGDVLATLRVPLSTSDFSPFLQRAADAKPDALFIFVPTGLGAALMKQFVERGLGKAGIRPIAEGSVTEDDVITQMDNSVLDMVTSHHYSAAHDSEVNKAFVAAFSKANDGRRPNHVAVHAYDGVHLIYEALKKTGGDTYGTALLEAMKGLSWESPRGPFRIDPTTREPVQNIYIRKVEKAGGELYNVEFKTYANVGPEATDIKA